MLRRFLTVCVAATACAGASSSSCQFGGSTDGFGPAFVTDLTLRTESGEDTRTFDRGQPIVLVLTVRNRRAESVVLQFPTERTSDFIVVRAGSNNLVWKWSDGRAFATVVTEIELEANESRTFSATWDQNDSAGSPVDAGSYEARGVLVYEGFDADPLRADPLGSTLERFTIL